MEILMDPKLECELEKLMLVHHCYNNNLSMLQLLEYNTNYECKQIAMKLLKQPVMWIPSVLMDFLNIFFFVSKQTPKHKNIKKKKIEKTKHIFIFSNNQSKIVINL